MEIGSAAARPGFSEVSLGNDPSRRRFNFAILLDLTVVI
jgi:hypothetical protein